MGAKMDDTAEVTVTAATIEVTSEIASITMFSSKPKRINLFNNK
jgi:hypothetical protein